MKSDKPRENSLSRREFISSGASALAASIMFSRVEAAIATGSEKPGSADWPRYGCNNRNTRWNSGERTIGKNNVGQLKPKWKFDLDVPIECTPAVVGDTLWFGAPGGFYAVNSHTGALKGKYPMPNGGTQSVQRGGEYYKGRFYSGDSAGLLHCLDAATLRKVWERDFSTYTELPDERVVRKGISITGSCVAFDDKIYFGTTGFKNRVVCVNADNGTTAWEYWVTGEHDIGKGGSMWTSPAVDEKERILYVATGSNKFLGAGDPVLFTESILAFDADTGYLRWYYQAHPNDTFDLDWGCHPIVFDAAGPLMKKGATRQCVAAGNKDGIYCFDRYSGELLWRTQLTQTYHYGGPNVDSIAFDNNKLYLVSNAATQLIGKPPISVTAALDSYTGRIVWWTYNLESICLSGIGGANGVLYQGFTDGRLEALDADTGRVLWQYTLPTAKRGGFAIANGAMYCCNAVATGQVEGGASAYVSQERVARDRRAGAYSVWCFTVDGK